MTLTVTSTECQNNFGRYLELVQKHGEIIITKNGKEYARLISDDKKYEFLSEKLVGLLSEGGN